MKSKGMCALAVMILCLTAFAIQSVSHYEFVRAGNFPGGTLTVPLAVDLVHIVGEFESSDGIHAYVQTGNSFVRAEPSGSLESYLSGINSHGIAVGGYCPKGCNPETGQYGYKYDIRTGKIFTIRFPLADAATTAYGLNNGGLVVGGYCPNNNVCPSGLFNPTDHGFVDDRGTFATLDFPGAQATTAFAVNDADTIVGFYLINNTGPHAFLYQNGTFTTIDFPGSGYTIATAVNNLGAVAGLFADSTGVHGFIYYAGAFTQIDRPNATATAVTGINDRNELVGTWNPTIGEKNFRAIPVAAPVQP